jgi:hypothetical protein
MTANESEIFSRLLEAFPQGDPLRRRLAVVLQSLPRDVQHDFLHDPRFRITRLLQQQPHDQTLLALPAADGRASRCVVLKERLASCPEAYGLYVIAHELAHAHLRNGPWGEITDREQAADALAARWGFPRPASRV